MFEFNNKGFLRAAVSDETPFLCVGREFSAEADRFVQHFVATLPDENPGGFGRNALAFAIALRRAAKLRSSRDDESAGVLDVFGDEADERRLNGRRIDDESGK